MTPHPSWPKVLTWESIATTDLAEHASFARAKVPGGWLVRMRSQLGTGAHMSESIAFVPDAPSHIEGKSWHPPAPPPPPADPAAAATPPRWQFWRKWAKLSTEAAPAADAVPPPTGDPT